MATHIMTVRYNFFYDICFLLFVFLLGVKLAPISDNELTELNFIHINDFHARFAETSNISGDCKDVQYCIGGFSRMYKLIRTALDAKPDSLLLNSGDNFQGSLYYNLFKYNITAQFMNDLPFDAITLGNHEFDDGIAGVVPFIQMLKAPVIVSNINDTLEPTMQGIYQKSVVVERQGKKIGIIGVIIHSCNELAKTQNLSFFDESESINAEAKRLVEEENVFTNIVISHSGYEVEQLMAQKATNKISAIFGGHTHSFLYTGDSPPGPDRVAGPYPTVVNRTTDGKIVLVTQASAFTKYVGNITIWFDYDGNVADWAGSPIFLDTPLPKDKTIDANLEPWAREINKIGSVIVGSSLVTLNKNGCRKGECLLGDFLTDAFVYAYINEATGTDWTAAAISLMNTGGLRTTIPQGNITYSDLINAQPFGNTVNVGEMTGKDLRQVFEFSATPYSSKKRAIDINLLQVAGVKVTLDIGKPIGSRVTELQVRCAQCEVPSYSDVDDNATYKVIVPSFLQTGGDGFQIIEDSLKNIVGGPIDVDVFMNYLRDRSPILQGKEGRITILGADKVVA